MRTNRISFVFISLLAVSLLLCSGVVYAGSHVNWEFVYENDVNGNCVSGNLNDLVAAVENGADVKVSLLWNNGIDECVYSITSPVAAVNSTTNGKVVWIKVWKPASDTNANGYPYLNEDSMPPLQIYRSDSVRESITYDPSGDTMKSHNTSHFAMKWYVNK